MLMLYSLITFHLTSVAFVHRQFGYGATKNLGGDQEHAWVGSGPRQDVGLCKWENDFESTGVR